MIVPIWKMRKKVKTTKEVKEHKKVKIPSLVKLASLKASEQFNNSYALPDDDQVTHITSLPADTLANLSPFSLGIHCGFIY